MKIIKTEAVMLKKKSLLNKDYLITIFSETEGKIKVFAKGVKKITSRRLSHLETGNLIEAILYKKDDRFYLQNTRLISGFSKIKNNQQKSNFLYYFLFILDRIMADNQRDFSVYNLVKKFLIKLSEDDKFNQLHLSNYLNRLMKDLGYLKDEKSSRDLRYLIEEIINEKLPSDII